MKSTLLSTLLLTVTMHICMSQSGITWNTTIDVNAMSMYGNQHPRIVLDRSGDPMILWGNASNNNAYFSKWNGAGFTTPVIVNPSFPVFAASWAGPDLESNGDTLYIVVKEFPEFPNPAYIFASYDGGISFLPAVQVDAYIGDSLSRFPTVTVDENGQPIVAYMKINPDFLGARYVVTRSNDFGATFEVDKLATGWSGGEVCDCCPATIVDDGSRVAVLYRGNNSNIRDMWAGISNDYGNSFTSGFFLDNPNWMLMMCPSSSPDGVIVGDKLHSVLISGFTGDFLLYYSIGTLSSSSNDTVYPLTGMLSGLTTQNYPRMATDGSAMAIVWKQARSGQDQLPLLFTNNINNGFPAQYDTVDLDNVVNTDVAVLDGAIHIVWEDESSGTVKYRKGTYTSTLAIEQEEENMFQIYPNPAKDLITIKANQSDFTWTISDMNGKVVKSGYSGVNEFNIMIPELNNGNYILSIHTKDKTSTSNFIKQ